MIYSFSYEPKIAGRALCTIEDCCAVIDPYQYDPSDWTIYGLMIDGTHIPAEHPLYRALTDYLLEPAQEQAIDLAWRFRDRSEEAA